MKLKNHTAILKAILFLIVLILCVSYGFTQEPKKERIRISASYTNLIDGEDYLDIKLTARIDKKTLSVPHVRLSIYADNEEGEVLLGSTESDMNGTSVFVLNNPEKIIPDSTHVHSLKIKFDGNDTFRKASRSVQYKKAEIIAKTQTRDSVNYIVATLRDTAKDSVIEGEALTVRVKRLFMPLQIGEEFNMTDDNGTIIVPIDSDIPGIDGNLDLEVVLNEHDEYGTVIAQVEAPVGVPIIEDTTYFERTMWSPSNKTPLFLLIFPNLLIIAMWGIIVYLFINLFKISKN